MKLKVYGHSDDIVVVEGDITEEFYPPSEGAFYVAVSDGTLLRIIYDDAGMWQIRIMEKGKETEYDYHQAQDEDSDYSDIVTIESPRKLKWVVAGRGLRE